MWVVWVTARAEQQPWEVSSLCITSHIKTVNTTPRSVVVLPVPTKENGGGRTIEHTGTMPPTS